MPSLILEFPVELLQRVFSFLPDIPPSAPIGYSWKKVEYALAPPLPPTTTADKISRRGWTNAAFICSHWRSVALGMKRTVPISLVPQKAEKDLEKDVPSVFKPLSVMLYIEQFLIETPGHGFMRLSRPWQGSSSSPMRRLANMLKERVKGVHIYLGTSTKRQTIPISMTSQLSDFCHFAVHYYTHLDELHLVAPGRNHRHGICSTPYGTDGAITFPGTLPEGRKLRVLELRDCHFVNPADVFASVDLRRLTLIASTDAWPLAAHSTDLRKLEYLCLTLESIPKQSTIAVMDRIEMPSLKYLHLGGFMYNVGALLSKLSFPASASIVLRCDFNANSVSEPVCPIVTPLAEHLKGSCTEGEGFTNVALRIKHLETEVICSVPSSRAGPATSSVLSPSTSITVSLSCRLRRESAILGQTHTAAISEDLLIGMCTHLPHASGTAQTLEIALPSPRYLEPTRTYWLEAASSLSGTTEIRVDGNAARALLEFISTRRTQKAEAPFPRLRRFRTVARRARPEDVQELHQLLRDETGERGADCAIPLEDIRVD